MTNNADYVTALPEAGHACYALMSGWGVREAVLHPRGARADEAGHVRLHDPTAERDAEPTKFLCYLLAGAAAEARAGPRCARPSPDGGATVSTPRRVSFTDCRTRAEAMARFATWLDAYEADVVRQVASSWLLDEHTNGDDLAAFQSEQAAVRAMFTGRRRAEMLDVFARALDEAFGPDVSPEEE